MSKILLFFVAVFAGVGVILFFANQAQEPKQNTPFPTIAPSGSPAPSGTNPSISPLPTTIPNVKNATIKTTKGNIVIELYPNNAPKTVENFANKADVGFYDNLTFHRVEDWVVQGGDPKGDGTGGGQIPTELNNKPFVVGSLGVARRGDIKVSNDAQFFITKKTSPHLNGQYTNFGIVTKGMDVVDKIEIGDKILGITLE